MTPPPPEDRAQLEFLQNVQRIFEEGEFVATYKFALLVALVELAIERGEDTGAPLELPIWRSPRSSSSSTGPTPRPAARPTARTSRAG